MRTLSKLNLKNKTVLLRADLNSDIVNGKVVLSERIKKSAKTIIELKRRKAKVVIIAHQGRKNKSDFSSLKQHAKLLSSYTKVRFVDDIIGEKAQKEIINLNSGDAILLENIRSLDEEINPKINNGFVKILSKLCDIYINDAFSVSHRNHSSIVSFPKLMPSAIGRLMEEELNALSKLKLKNSLYILAGAKPEENLLLLKSLKKQIILTFGLFGQLCTIAKGYNFGAQNNYLKDKLYIIPRLKRAMNTNKLEIPSDFAVKVNGKRKELALKDFPSEYEIYDIAEHTIGKYVKEIKKAKVVFMKGPAGDCSQKIFCKGTKALLKAMEKNRGFTMIGGGHSSEAAAKLGIKKISYISLSGGALALYIAGKKLPGLEALK